ncbi:MAG: hypothetical protein JWR10_1267 [Rubritepida sp.]|nr:hypothetical protein [Rubritepida sp.]
MYRTTRCVILGTGGTFLAAPIMAHIWAPGRAITMLVPFAATNMLGSVTKTNTARSGPGREG